MYNHKEILENYIKQHKLLLFTTLTFYKNVPLYVERKAINCYLSNFNRQLFRKSWKKLNLYVSGFAAREQNRVDGQGHYHLLIKENPQIRPDKRKNIFNLHNKSVWKVKNIGFEHDIQFIYSEGVIGYILKYVDKFDKMFYFNKEGIE